MYFLTMRHVTSPELHFQILGLTALYRLLFAFACFLGAPLASFADLAAWQTTVSAGTPAVTHFTTVAGASPIRLNVGAFAAGSARSFEFVYIGTGNGISNTLLASQDPASGGQFLKANQYNATGKYGLTTNNVVDEVFVNSPTLLNQQVHAVFVSTGSVTSLYLNGVLQTATIARGMGITGLNGLGAGDNAAHNAFFDNLAGSIFGFASYGRVLTQAEVTARRTALVAPGAASTVSVGSSSLIGTLHYSDSLTIGAGAPVLARTTYPGTFPLSAAVAVVENVYGNAARSWSTSAFSIATDTAVSSTADSPYPGTSGAGSATGFTQSGVTPGAWLDWSIFYDLSNDFVIQFDAVQMKDRVDVSIGNTGGNLAGAGNLTIFFRPATQAYPQVSIYNHGVGEFNTGLTSGIATAGQWNNYAVRVNIPAQTITVYVNQTSRGVINLATLNGGAYAPFLINDYVGIGGAGNDRL
jgi:hypothetical protein